MLHLPSLGIVMEGRATSPHFEYVRCGGVLLAGGSMTLLRLLELLAVRYVHQTEYQIVETLGPAVKERTKTLGGRPPMPPSLRQCNDRLLGLACRCPPACSHGSVNAEDCKMVGTV